MQNRCGYYLIITVLAAALFVSGCSDSRHLRKLQAYIEKAKATAAQSKTTSTIPGLETPTPVIYSAQNLRSPFELIAGPADQQSNGHPLESYPLAALHFKGTATQNGENWAFIMTPDNKLYQSKLGDVIGDHYGKIVQISPTSIEVDEKVEGTAPNEKSSTRIVILRLKD